MCVCVTERETDRQVIPQRPTQFATVTILPAMKIFMLKYYHKRHEREAFNVKPDNLIERQTDRQTDRQTLTQRVRERE